MLAALEICIALFVPRPPIACGRWHYVEPARTVIRQRQAPGTVSDTYDGVSKTFVQPSSRFSNSS